MEESFREALSGTVLTVKLTTLVVTLRNIPFGVKTASTLVGILTRQRKAGVPGVRDHRAESLIGLIYDAACDQSRWPDALQKLADASGSLCATYFVWRKDVSALGFFAASPDYMGEDIYGSITARSIHGGD
jgi:hypothetical protein